MFEHNRTEGLNVAEFLLIVRVEELTRREVYLCIQITHVQDARHQLVLKGCSEVLSYAHADGVVTNPTLNQRNEI